VTLSYLLDDTDMQILNDINVSILIKHVQILSNTSTDILYVLLAMAHLLYWEEKLAVD
jgi:hypothetical protein